MITLYVPTTCVLQQVLIVCNRIISIFTWCVHVHDNEYFLYICNKISICYMVCACMYMCIITNANYIQQNIFQIFRSSELCISMLMLHMCSTIFSITLHPADCISAAVAFLLRVPALVVTCYIDI
jgi:hypothetical protein